MAQPLVRIPLQYPLASQVGLHTYRVVFWLDLLHSSGTFVRSTMPFRLDTGADFTTIPVNLARQLGLDYQVGKLVYPTTTAGKSQNPSYLTKFWFSFPTLSQWRFRGHCLVTPYPLKRCLFSLNDLVPHFTVRSSRASPTYPFGSVAFQLRSDHGGVRRT